VIVTTASAPGCRARLRSYTKALDLTRRAVEAAGPGEAAFGAAVPETRQRACGECGACGARVAAPVPLLRRGGAVVKNRKQVIAALKRAGDGYQNAASAIWDLVDGEKALTLNNLLALRDEDLRWPSPKGSEPAMKRSNSREPRMTERQISVRDRPGGDVAAGAGAPGSGGRAAAQDRPALLSVPNGA
jgi:hypothetical protein